LLISLVVLSIFAAGILFLEEGATSSLLVPLPAAIAAGITAVISFISYILAPQKYLYQLAFINYLLLAATTGLLIALTGEIRSPYLVLWMLLSIFAGLFGRLGLGLIFAAVNLALAYEFFASSAALTRDTILIYLLALEAPLVISFIIWHDKTNQEQKKTQAFDALAEQLSQVANKSEIVINAIAEGVVAIDARGVIQLVNPAAQELLGWIKHDAIGLDYRSVIKLSDQNGKEVIPETSPIYQVLTSNKPLVNNDLALTTSSGKKIFISLVVSPVGNDDGATGAIAVFRDITREKEEERQKAEFISTASHEMRTPVAAIEGYLGLALNPNTAAIDDKARAYLMKAHEATQHLGTLFQDLLTVSRAEDNRLIPKPTVVDAVSFVRSITESLTQKAQAKGLFLHFKPGGIISNTDEEGGNRKISPAYYSYVDQNHLREIINNLVDNAIKYTRQGNVAIDIRGDDNNLTISIADTGIGIPPEDVPHLFQKFYRIDNSDTREIGGTGLGLYICRRLAEANNGHIWVESAYGKGSTFYVQIPRISHERANELANEDQTATTPVQGSPAITPQPAITPATAAAPPQISAQ
jgi:PAS domain S-box-containing protein